MLWLRHVSQLSAKNLGILTTSDWAQPPDGEADQPHEDEMCQVRVPKVEKRVCSHFSSECYIYL